MARLVETSLKEVDPKVIEAAQTMGATGWQIVWKVLLPESIPSLIRGTSISAITLIGYSAMAGTVGGGGLGDIAIRYGYQRYQQDVMIVTIILLVIIVQILSLIHISRRRSRMAPVVMASRAEVGSSQSRILGSLARARAIATRCFCPPESWAG